MPSFCCFFSFKKERGVPDTLVPSLNCEEKQKWETKKSKKKVAKKHVLQLPFR